MTQTINQSNFSDIFNCFIDLLAEKVVEKIATKPQKAESKAEKSRLQGVRNIAKYLKLSTGTVQKLINEKRIPVYYTGSKLYGYDIEIETALRN